jgi:hypothetical protein
MTIGASTVSADLNCDLLDASADQTLVCSVSSAILSGVPPVFALKFSK